MQINQGQTDGLDFKTLHRSLNTARMLLKSTVTVYIGGSRPALERLKFLLVLNVTPIFSCVVDY